MTASCLEKAVCADPELSQLDEALNVGFASARQRASVRRRFAADQTIWLRFRDDLCAAQGTVNHDCLRTMYRRRGEHFAWYPKRPNYKHLESKERPDTSAYVVERGQGVEVCEAYRVALALRPRPRWMTPPGILVNGYFQEIGSPMLPKHRT